MKYDPYLILLNNKNSNPCFEEFIGKADSYRFKARVYPNLKPLNPCFLPRVNR